MKPLFTLILITSITFCGFAQELNWHKIISAEGNDWGIGTATDSDGNVYSIGFYRDSELMLDGTTLPFAENMDSYLAKFSEQGDLQWSIPFYGMGLFDRVEDIFIDDEDNVYVICLMQNVFMIGDQETIVVSDDNSIDFILMKFTPDGDLLFHKTFGGPGTDIAYGFSLEGDEILLAGHMNDEFSIGSDTLRSNDGQDMLLLSLDKSGELNWMRSFGGNGSDRLYNVRKLDNGHIVVCGYSASEFEFGETNLVGNVSIYGGFIGLLDEQGLPIRAHQILPSESLATFDRLTVIGNDVYTLANLRDSSLIDGSYYGQEDYNTFILSKLNASLAFEWIKEIPAMNDTSYIQSYHITDYQGQPWLAGVYKGEVNFNGMTTSALLDNGIVLSFNDEGQIDNQILIESDAALNVSGLDFSSNSLSVSGVLTGTGTLGGEAFQTRNSDILLLNYDIDFLTSTESPVAHDAFSIYPNPVEQTLFIKDESLDFMSVAIYNSAGMLIKQSSIKSEINVNDLAKGVYYLKMRNNTSHKIRMFVKQ